MCLEGVKRLGPHLHPEITLTGVAMHHMLDAWDRGDLRTLRAMFVEDMVKLVAAGADFFVCPGNTPHNSMGNEGGPLPPPGPHLGGEGAEPAGRDGRSTGGR